MSTSTTADRQYVWHPYYIDALATSYNSSGTAHYYVQDGNFNVTAAMDSSGAVVERYSYTPYGECIVLNADFTLDSSSGGDGLSDISNEFTYTGRRLDVETGLYQYRHRYHHAQLGRFVNRDPIGYAGKRLLNFYGYVDCHPINRIDFNGLCACDSEEIKSRTLDPKTTFIPISSALNMMLLAIISKCLQSFFPDAHVAHIANSLLREKKCSSSMHLITY